MDQQSSDSNDLRNVYGTNIPPEPPPGTVVLDNEHDAWQLDPDGWACTVATDAGAEHYAGWTWARLVADHGPLTRMVPAGDTDQDLRRHADRADAAERSLRVLTRAARRVVDVASGATIPIERLDERLAALRGELERTTVQDDPDPESARIIRTAWEAVEARDPDAVSGWSHSLADAIRTMTVPVLPGPSAPGNEHPDVDARDLRPDDPEITGPNSFTLYRRACERAAELERERDQARAHLARYRGTPALRDAARGLLAAEVGSGERARQVQRLRNAVDALDQDRAPGRPVMERTETPGIFEWVRRENGTEPERPDPAIVHAIRDGERQAAERIERERAGVPVDEHARIVPDEPVVEPLNPGTEAMDLPTDEGN